MKSLTNLVFRITSRLFAFFMDYLGRTLRNKWKLDLSNTTRKRLLVVRQGGIGDLLFISAAIRELKTRHPYLTIDLMCHPRFHGIFHRTTCIDRLIEHRWPSVFKLLDYDYFVFLDGVIECDADAETTNIYDLLANKYFGIQIAPSANKPFVIPNPAYVPSLAARIPGFVDAKIRIGLQPFANSPVRTPSMWFWTRAARSTLERIPEAQLFVLAEKGRSLEAEELVNMINAGYSSPRAISTAGTTSDAAELTALVSMLNAVLAPDSSVTHLAAAFDIPTLAVYGPFPSKLRTHNYQFAISLDAKTECTPCFTHGHLPCSEARKAGIANSPCFDSISQPMLETAIDALQLIIRRHGQLGAFDRTRESFTPEPIFSGLEKNRQPYRNQMFGCTTFSQYGEDLIVANIFKRLGIERPSYIDIGAHHPFDCSNTALFYATGSRGINIEPNSVLFDIFCTHRPKDVNLNIGVGPRAGELEFFMMGDFFGRNTFLPEVATACEKQNAGVRVNRVVRVPVLTFNDVIEKYAGGTCPDYLTIDAEGMDLPILRTADFSRTAPFVICAENFCGIGDQSVEIIEAMKGKDFVPIFRTVGNILFVRIDVFDSLT